MIVISTAFKKAQISIELNGKTCYSSIDSNCKHSENVLVSLNDCLQQIGETLESNDVLAVVEGPGSFTGLRISAALIKGFCSGLGIDKILPISSFELIADEFIQKSHPKANFLCIINALSGKYFVCEFDKDAKKISEAQILTQEELDIQKLIKVGLEEENIGDEKVVLSSERLLLLAKRKSLEDKFINVDTFSPVYLRKSQAEDMALEKNTKK